MTTLTVHAVTAENFAPYGRLIQLPNRPSDAQSSAFQWWGDNAHLDASESAYQIGYLTAKAAASFDWAERHMKTQELIIPVYGDILVYVAPPAHMDAPDRLDSTDGFAIFSVAPGQAVLLERGVWHGAPIAAAGEAQVIILLKHGTAPDDLFLQRFSAVPFG